MNRVTARREALNDVRTYFSTLERYEPFPNFGLPSVAGSGTTGHHSSPDKRISSDEGI